MEVKHKDWDHICPGNGCRYPSCENNASNVNRFVGLNWPGGVHPSAGAFGYPPRGEEPKVTKLVPEYFPPVNRCQPKSGYDPLYRRILQSENTLAKFHSRLREIV